MIPSNIDELLHYGVVWYPHPRGHGWSTSVGMNVATLQPEGSKYLVTYDDESRTIATLPPRWRFEAAFAKAEPLAKRAEALAADLLRVLGGPSVSPTKTLIVRDRLCNTVLTYEVGAAGARPAASSAEATHGDTASDAAANPPVLGVTVGGAVVWTLVEQPAIWTRTARKLEVLDGELVLGFARVAKSAVAVVEVSRHSIAFLLRDQRRIVVVALSEGGDTEGLGAGAGDWAAELGRDLSAWLVVPLVFVS